MDKILEVKKLKISFRTNSGTVKAVRDISFDLERGKTLAIVGESGSGKSVTSKAIMGILAGNSIIDGGEILYDGRDLLKITEEEMCDVRGNKISMIFQDPLSSLNPIVKIGKQITEAMLLKNKINRRTARKHFNSMLALLKTNMVAAEGKEESARINGLISTFDKFCIEANHLENSYNVAESFAVELQANIEDFLFLVSKNQKVDVRQNINDYLSRMKAIKDPFFTANFDARLSSLREELAARKSSKPAEGEMINADLANTLQKIDNLLKEMCEQKKPNFFRIGYYKLQNPNADLLSMSRDELDRVALEYLSKNFMNDFIKTEQKAIAYSHNTALELKRALMADLEEAKKFYSGEYSKSEARSYGKALIKKVEQSIDRMEILKDSAAYTFGTSLNYAVDKYFKAVKNNPKEEKRFARQTAKRERMIAHGKKVDWKVVPKQVFDLDELKANIVAVVDRIETRYKAYIETPLDLDARSNELIDYLKEQASEVVYRVTKMMAKQKAIKLMEEVGIHEPRRRYYQYPFEFSGGMRQRIVIAIALAANPDILICDEPTTALDVTIQAQILELINRLKVERNLSVIFITHDLGVVANMADDIAVMYAGKIVEYGTADDVFYDPRHPYTWALLASMPDLDTKEKLDAIPGTPPNMIYPPEGDAFAARNKYAMQIDFEQQPPLFPVSETHSAATWLLHPDAPKVDMPKIISDRIERMLKKNGGAENEQ